MALWRPTGATSLTPLENAFDALADSIEALPMVGSVADLAAVAAYTTANVPVAGDLLQIQEGLYYLEYTGSIWKQITPATFATSSARDTALAKASAAYLVQGFRVFRTDMNWTEEYSAVYNSSTNIAGRDTAGWYPVSVDIKRKYYVPVTPQGYASGAAIATLVVKRRPYAQRVVVHYFGNIAGTSISGAALTATTGGTITSSGFVIVAVGGSGVSYTGVAYVDIAAGTGTDVTINLINGSGSITTFGGMSEWDILVAGEY